MAKLSELMDRLRLTIAVPQSEENGEADNEKILRLDIDEYNYILESLRAHVKHMKYERNRAVATGNEMLRKTYGYKRFRLNELIRKLRSAKVQ